MITAEQARRAADVLNDGGVMLFGADTVYGLACAADRPDAVERLIALKGRAADKPNATLGFSLAAAEPVLCALPPRTQAAARALLPGAVTLVLPGGTGLRVPELVPGAVALGALTVLVVQSSANAAGAPAPALLDDVDPDLRGTVDLVLDAGPLPGTASTVVDLTDYEQHGTWHLLREGAVSSAAIGRRIRRETNDSAPDRSA